MSDLVRLDGSRILIGEIPLVIDDRLIGFDDEVHRIASRSGDRHDEYLRSEDGFDGELFGYLSHLSVIIPGR